MLVVVVYFEIKLGSSARLSVVRTPHTATIDIGLLDAVHRLCGYARVHGNVSSLEAVQFGHGHYGPAEVVGNMLELQSTVHGPVELYPVSMLESRTPAASPVRLFHKTTNCSP